MTPTSRVLIFGAGAIGQWLAAMLECEGGAEVSLIARPQFCAAIAESGLHWGPGKRAARPVCHESVAGLGAGRFDHVVLTVKAPQVADAVRELLGCGLEASNWITLQNGIGSDEVVAEALAPAPLLVASTTRAVGSSQPAHLEPEDRGGLALANLRGHQGPPTIFSKLRLPVVWYPDYRAMKWSKLLLNMVCNASCALLDWLPGQVVASPTLYAMEIEAVREALRVIRSEGRRLVDLPDYPVRLFSHAVGLPPLVSRRLLGARIARARGRKPPSFLLDLRAGRGVTEVGFLNGAVADRGRELGVPTPINEYLTRTLQAVVSGAAPWTRFQGNPEELLEDLARFKDSQGGDPRG